MKEHILLFQCLFPYENFKNEDENISSVNDFNINN